MTTPTTNTVLTEGERTRLLLPGRQRLVLRRAPQRLPVPQLRAVHGHRQTVSHLRCVDAPSALSGAVVLPAQRRRRVRARPAAGELDVGGVLGRRPHTVRVSV